jgi:hypothetical protein
MRTGEGGLAKSNEEREYGSGRGRAYGVCNGREEREREAEKHWRRERENGRKEEGGPVMVINWDPQKN